MPTWLIWVIVIVVVLIVIGLIVSMMNKRRTEQKRGRAEDLRTEASTQAGGLTESQRQAEELRAKADLARTEAQRSEEQAAAAQQGHQVEQASYEDKLREADKVDPEVNTRAKEYEPSVWNDESGDARATDGVASTSGATGGSHRDVSAGTTGETTETTAPDDTAAAPQTGTSAELPDNDTRSRTTE